MMNFSEIESALGQAISDIPLGKKPPELYDPIRYIMALGGKRLRPKLVLLAYALFEDNWQKALSPALSVEVFHNFTLMHDDIMDNAPLRRGKATVHERWSPNVAILSGDVMLVKSYDLLLDMASDKLPTALRAFNRCAAEVCEGQQLDMNFETIDRVSEAEYLEMIRLKTAVLLGFSLKLGAILANASTENAEILRQFGENIGIGFQLKDDLLDVYGDAQKFGKQVGGDIIANKKTFLLIKALEKAEGDTAQQLQKWLKAEQFDKTEKVAAVTEIYNRLNIRQLSEAKMNHYFSAGLEQLKALSCPKANNKEALLQFVEQLMHREK